MTTLNLVERKKFTWKVNLAERDSGAPTVYSFSSFWSPDKVSAESVSVDAAAEASVLSGKKYLPMGCVLSN